MRYPVCLFVLFVSVIASQDVSPGYKILRKLYEQCGKSENMFKCLKIQALKFTDRALHVNSINLLDGVSIVKNNKDAGRSMPMVALPKLDQLESNEVDGLLIDRVGRFFRTHEVQISMPKLLEESRGKKKNNYAGPLMVALAIKGGLFAMAYQSVALLAGKALIIGKIALVLSAILGLKKLLSGGGGHGKTTYEIVKHPHVTHSNTYSSSHQYGDGYEASGGGHYRSLDGESMVMQERAYRAHVPSNN